MKLLRTLRLLLTFYRITVIPNTAMTIICGGLFWEYGFSIFTVIFWLKLAVMTLVFYYIRSYKNYEFYYYQNLGLSKTLLWTTTLSVDFILFLFLLNRITLLPTFHA